MGTMRNKVVTVGDPEVGKTSLLTRFAHGRFSENYLPTVFENYVAELIVGRETKELFLWDTTGEEGYTYLRVLAYPSTDVILLTFAIDNPASLLNLQLCWLPEVKHYLPHVPIVMVGLKSDLREGEHKVKLVSKDTARCVSSTINAFDYIECSALSSKGVREVFITAVRAVLHNQKIRRKRSCCIL